MKDNERHLLANYQSLMEPHEKMIARWLTEEWDGVGKKVPQWLYHKTWMHYSPRDFGKPDAMARVICLRLLRDHKNELALSNYET